MKINAKSAFALLCTIITIAVLSLGSVGTNAQEYPKATGYVNDFANILTSEVGSKLNQELIDFEKKTSIEITVVTINSLGGMSVEGYTHGLANEWGVGKREKNNGVVFLVAPNDRKMRIETGSGVRSVLTDSIAASIRDTAILPNFKAGNTAQGVIDGTHAIINALDAKSDIKQEAVPQNTNHNVVKLELWVLFGLILVPAAIFIFVIKYIMPRHSRDYVLSNINWVRARLDTAEAHAKHPSTKEVTRHRLSTIKSRLSTFDNLTATSKDVNWIDKENELQDLSYSLKEVTAELLEEIAFSYKARSEGPELMKRVPDMIGELESKISSGKTSSDAQAHLDEARALYAQAQDLQTGSSITDWVLLYSLLQNVERSVSRAEESQSQADNYVPPKPTDYGTGDSSSNTVFSGGSFDSGSSGSDSSPPASDSGSSGSVDSGGATGSW